MVVFFLPDQIPKSLKIEQGYPLTRIITRRSFKMSAADYDKLSLHEQILKRPDTYVGTNNTNTEHRWIWDTASQRMVWKSVTVNPALLKIVDEVLVNALDHRVRMLQKGTPMKHLDVTITPQRITVRNDGDGIPVDEHPVHKVFAPELIFGNLLTSSNYDDSEKRIVGGMNGYGAKLTNIFSTEFSVETVDASRQKKYKQVWKKNMFECGKASITKCTTKPYTEISFCPDLTRFKWPDVVPTEIPADMVEVLATRVVDAAACAGKECKVTLNGTLCAANTFQKYVDLYVDSDGDSETATEAGSTTSSARKAKRIAYEQAGERWEVAAILTEHLHGDCAPNQRHVSFVNSINTRRGGNHVDYVSAQVLADFCEMAKKKKPKVLADLTPAIIKPSVVWFINATIENPSFDTQTKESLMTPVRDFGSKPAVSAKFIAQLEKIGLMDEAQQLMDAKLHKDAKKTDGKKKSKITGIPKLEDATWAGTAKSAECTLILTEGDSAKTTAISGLKVVGRETYGVFPLKGKILNVKDAPEKKKSENQEIQYIKQILGLEHKKVYTDLKQLRYGRIMIMTDQDVDGSHIKGLLMNLFHTEWPSLLHLDFICCLMTPLLKATKGDKTLCFYSETEYEAWQQSKTASELRGWRIKYYKGLGTSTAAEAREYFSNMNMVEFKWDEASDMSLDLAFNKKRADDRKEWLTTYDRKRSLNVTSGGAKVNYSRFVNDELIHFSNADNIRSIPHIMDGLKPSQRKILWACLKRNLTSEIKVAQLAGYVSETAAYHHGEVSLQGAIVGMAQNFVGSNNINMLVPSGQFGTRLQGGDDASAPRYIFTALEPVTRFLMRKEDDAVLAYTEDDGQKVEPESYMPTIPTLLVNGAKGIGTGFSTTILPYNPRDLMGAMRARLRGMSTLTDMTLTPWWADFKGRVVGSADGKTWITRGVYEFLDDDAATIRISELPVGTWTLDYKEFLEKMLVEQEEAKSLWQTASKKAAKEGTPVPEKPAYWLQSYEEAYNDTDADFILHMDPDAYHEARAYTQEFETRFKLSTSFKTSNMVAFNTAGVLKKYATVGEILEEFYQERHRMYGVRKGHELKRMEEEIRELDARYVFVKAVVDKRLIVANAEDEDLLAGLKALALPPLSDMDSNDLRGYEYLLRMRVDRLKAVAVAELAKELGDMKAKHEALMAKSVEEIWLDDLAALEGVMNSYFDVRKAAKEEASVAAPTVKKVVRKPRTKKV